MYYNIKFWLKTTILKVAIGKASHLKIIEQIPLNVAVNKNQTDNFMKKTEHKIWQKHLQRMSGKNKVQ